MGWTGIAAVGRRLTPAVDDRHWAAPPGDRVPAGWPPLDHKAMWPYLPPHRAGLDVGRRELSTRGLNGISEPSAGASTDVTQGRGSISAAPARTSPSEPQRRRSSVLRVPMTNAQESIEISMRFHHQDRGNALVWAERPLRRRQRPAHPAYWGVMRTAHCL